MVGAKEPTLVPMGEELLRATLIPATTRFLIPLNWSASLHGEVAAGPLTVQQVRDPP